MPTILVVDDAATDRLLAGQLLDAPPARTVLYAEHGGQALERLGEHAVDLVVTDLLMPEMDGLGLVKRMKDEYPLIPVLVMTARGSEEAAVKALEAGASSYVTKKALARDLLETVNRILAASQEHDNYRRLLGHLHEASFVLENDLELVSALVSYLTQTLRDSRLLSESECHHAATALDEALSNAVYHGNLEMRAELRERDIRAYRSFARERCRQEPYCNRRVHVTVRFSPTEASFVIRDEGPGFDPRAIPDPTGAESLARPGGRGVFLMRAFMDSVEFNDAGNEVTLRKRRTSSLGAPADQRP